MRELALFAGAGGGILGGLLLGWRTVCAVELDAYCRSVLLARQRDGLLPRFPIWDDVRTFDGRPWRGAIDVISGGFPCQDISPAGRGAGITGPKSGLWREFARIIGEVQPSAVFIENSHWLRKRGLDVVLGDLARLGFDAKWGVLGADSVGAPHIRRRLWILGSKRTPPDADDERHGPRAGLSEVASASTPQGHVGGAAADAAGAGGPLRGADSRAGWWPMAVLSGVDDGVAYRLERIAATGNGQVPGVAPLAWEALSP